MANLTFCRRCDAPVTRRDRKCSLCGLLAGTRLRTLLGGKPLLMKRRASYWALQLDLKKRSGMDDITIIQKVYRLHQRLLQKFSWRVLCANGLDNPYMSELARRVIVNQVLRLNPVGNVLRRTPKKPVQSVRIETRSRKRAA